MVSRRRRQRQWLLREEIVEMAVGVEQSPPWSVQPLRGLLTPQAQGECKYLLIR